MSTTINDLPSATSLTGAEEIPIVQTGTTKKVTKQLLTNQNYSETEQVVGTWIDGKPLYRKVVQLTTLPNNTTKTFAHGISNLEQIVQSTGTIWWANNKKEGNLLPYISGSTNFVSLYWDANYLTVRASGDYSGRDGLAILLYTKTTDSAS